VILIGGAAHRNPLDKFLTWLFSGQRKAKVILFLTKNETF
jgi:hypothetical protein